mmetsp:Transcript_176670/g.566520  ORF Transcript_176670/g.566520 Transcript_176670/m.566520 type:complete len:228 (+) Transcript_176670:474-1157(+)
MEKASVSSFSSSAALAALPTKMPVTTLRTASAQKATYKQNVAPTSGETSEMRGRTTSSQLMPPRMHSKSVRLLRGTLPNQSSDSKSLSWSWAVRATASVKKMLTLKTNTQSKARVQQSDFMDMMMDVHNILNSWSNLINLKMRTRRSSLPPVRIMRMYLSHWVSKDSVCVDHKKTCQACSKICITARRRSNTFQAQRDPEKKARRSAKSLKPISTAKTKAKRALLNW